MKPDASKLSKDASYLAGLVMASGMTLLPLAKVLGVHKRTLERYLAGSAKWPYSLQFSLEMLALNQRQAPETHVTHVGPPLRCPGCTDCSACDCMPEARQRLDAAYWIKRG